MSLALDAATIEQALAPLHPLGPGAAGRLATWTRALSTWNAAQRLVGWRRPEDLLHKGLADCWRGRALVELSAWPSLLDVGSGSGLPGLILAADAPDLPVHLVEARRKRAAFLREAARAMGLSRVVVHHGRSADVRQRLALDGCLFVSRAFAAPEDAAGEASTWNAGGLLVGTSAAKVDATGWPPAGWRAPDPEHGISRRRTAGDHHELLLRATS